MIPKNPKVGDTFVDEFTFKVVKVREDGTFVSQRVDMDEVVKTEDIPTEVKGEVEAEIKAEKTYSKTQINRTPNSELEKICKELGLPLGTGTEMKRAILDKLGL